MDKGKPRSKIGKTLTICGIIAMILIVIAVSIIILLQPKETHISSGTEKSSIEVLDCVSSVQNEPFFVSDKAIDSNHEVKITFNNNKPDKYNYTYIGKFDSNKIAEEELSWLHGDYNNYMGKIDIYQEDLSPSFTVLDNDVIINLYLDNKTLAVDTARFLFLTSEQFVNIKKMPITEVAKIYKNRSFNCVINK